MSQARSKPSAQSLSSFLLTLLFPFSASVIRLLIIGSAFRAHFVFRVQRYFSTPRTKTLFCSCRPSGCHKLCHPRRTLLADPVGIQGTLSTSDTQSEVFQALCPDHGVGVVPLRLMDLLKVIVDTIGMCAVEAVHITRCAQISPSFLCRLCSASNPSGYLVFSFSMFTIATSSRFHP